MRFCVSQNLIDCHENPTDFLAMTGIVLDSSLISLAQNDNKSQNLMNFRVDSAFFVRFCDSPRNNEKHTRFCESQNLRLPRKCYAFSRNDGIFFKIFRFAQNDK
ncbi:hypothetical protein ACWIUD_03995 [Helicobacter sp. 23-1044]